MRIDVIEDLLRTQTAQQVLTALASSNELLSTVSTLDVRCALVSYRQEKLDASANGSLHAIRRTLHGMSVRMSVRMQRSRRSEGMDDAGLAFAGRDEAATDTLTLDCEALNGILAAARQLGVDAVWLDAWCYRTHGGEYDHDEFVDLLHAVTEGVVAAVWLPRARRGSRGEYQYRLWCTFEAACIQQRGLRVAVAGEGMSSFQWRLRYMGSYAAAFWADGTLDQLCRLNLAFYAAEMLAALVLLLHAGYFLCSRFVLLTFVQAIFTFPFLWAAIRSSIGQQIRLAKNGQRTLRCMTDAVHGRGGDHVARQRLERELPWLPSYDRRDALVVHELLNRSRAVSADERSPGDVAASRDVVRALAFSAHAAARMQPSPGDASACTTTLRGWLLERGIRLAGVTADDGQSPMADQLTWLDGVARSSVRAEHCLPLEMLSQFRWVAAAGLTCSLVSPLGTALAVPPPAVEDGWSRWSVAGASPLQRPRLALAGSMVFLQYFYFGVVYSVSRIIIGFGEDSDSCPRGLVKDPPRFAIAVVSTGALVSTSVTFAVVFLLLLVSVLVADAACLRARQVPLPVVVFSSARENFVAGLAFAAYGGVQIWYSFAQGSAPLVPRFDPDDGGDATTSPIFALPVIVFSSYQVVTYAVLLLASSSRHCFHGMHGVQRLG